MIDENESPPDHRPGEQYGESLLYDFAKFLTTLSILTLGGVLTIAETADRGDIKTFNIIMVSVALALSAAVAAITASIVAVGRYTNQPLPPRLELWIVTSVFLLSSGVAIFVAMWIDRLNG
jgi:K+-sensing histidine kinase KdpD